jgi:hypothetical protein
MTQGGLNDFILFTYHLAATQLNSMACLPSPAGPLAAKLRVEDATPKPDKITPESTQKKKETGPSTPALGITSVGVQGRNPTALIVFTTTDSHKSASKYTRSFTENPNLRTIAVLQFALPMQINTEKELQRMAKCSSLSVFTKVDGKLKTAVDREPLSTGNGAIQLWLSDLVGEEEVKKLSNEFIRDRYVFLPPLLLVPLYRDYLTPPPPL